jgi:DNA-binding MarR family transcriptional regulator
MRIAQSDTARDAYRTLRQERRLQPMQERILACFAGDCGRGYTRKQLRDMTGLELSSVCGRVNSLIAAGLLEVIGEVRDPATGKMQELVGLPRFRQRSLFG